MSQTDDIFDVFVIGGGINGAGIFRDAAGRGYRVGLAEMNDLASATSSASTKLFHGGLRYLEYFEFGLVRKALAEREVLLEAMPHISWPMRFVLPVHSDMRFESNTPTSRLLVRAMPWLQGRRPRWLIRLGLFLYDQLGRRNLLPATSSLDLRTAVEGAPLNDQYEFAYEYSDCWVEDSRLTLLNVRDAADKGGTVFVRTKVISVAAKDGIWEIKLRDIQGGTQLCRAKIIVNAGGPWVEDVAQNVMRLNASGGIRLVRGSHIVTRKLFDHDKSYFLQGTDGRIMFAIPYEEDFTLIGTTDCEHANPNVRPTCSTAEIDYLIDFVNRYFRKTVTPADIVWTYSGVRPQYDDGAGSATAATRDYVMKLDVNGNAPALHVFGGKITTYRTLAEEALIKIDKALDRHTRPWTAAACLPGGDFAVSKREEWIEKLRARLPFLDDFTIRRLFRQYGTHCWAIFEDIKTKEQMGIPFGHGVFACEVDWAVANEWVRCAEDFLWRRSKMGLRFTPCEATALDTHIVDVTKKQRMMDSGTYQR
ncbi:glycerol-3-phosphate dehydrogenase [uncultured Tateyamaria sp.]|uniref:glycerol-3-phosphate dehydrogenase n=1 Tax=Tateyamaria sp. 1078 TaxID=3417464 RepID=UPI00262F4507|nr:glycerol-3-phosphate dehydrogenase [uncultured Tateyamaria sp.]